MGRVGKDGGYDNSTPPPSENCSTRVIERALFKNYLFILIVIKLLAKSFTTIFIGGWGIFGLGSLGMEYIDGKMYNVYVKDIIYANQWEGWEKMEGMIIPPHPL